MSSKEGTVYVYDINSPYNNTTTLTSYLTGVNSGSSLKPNRKTQIAQLLEKHSTKDESSEAYFDVWNLISHADNLEPEDVFQYAATAALLITYLERRTTFFESCASGNDRFVTILKLYRKISYKECS